MPDDLPDGYGDRFDYDVISESELMNIVNEIPEKALKAMESDVLEKFQNNEMPGQKDPHEYSVELQFDEWYNENHDELLANLKSWIPSSFETFLEPDPNGFFSPISDLKETKERFGVTEGEFTDEGFSGLTTSATFLATWEGDFASSSIEYVNSLYTIASNHGKVAQALWYNMEANKAIYAEARASAKRIAQKTISALDYYNEWQWFWDGPEADSKLAVAVAAGTLGAIAGGPVGLACAVVAGGATILQSVNDDTKGTDIDMAGDTAWDILDKMIAAQNTLSEQITQQEEDVIRGFQEGVADVIVDTITKDFNASTPKNSELLPMKIDANPDKIYQEDEQGGN